MDRPRPRDLSLAIALGLCAAAAVVACLYPGPPTLWHRLDFNGAPFEDFIGPYFETARAFPDADLPAAGFQYPAFFALLLAPLARLGPTIGSYAWLALELIATTLVIAAPLLLAAPRRAREAGAYVFAAGLSHPLAHNLYWGQVSTPLTLALLCATWAAARERPRLGACIIGFAAAVKLVPGLFLMGPLVRGKRGDACIGGVVALALITVPPLALLGWDRFVAFHIEVFTRLARLGAAVVDAEGGRGSQDLAAATARALSSWLPIGAGVGFALGRAAGLSLAVALLARLRHERDPGLCFASLSLLAPLLIAPTWSHGLAFVPAAAWFVWRDPRGNPWSRASAGLALTLTSLPLHAAFSDPDAYARSGLGALATCALTVGVLARRGDSPRAVADRHGPLG